MKQFIKTEVNTINQMFKQNSIKAMVVKANNIFDSFVRYELRLHPQQSFKEVEKLLRELTVAINRNRQRNNLPTTDIKPVDNPTFALEVDHPQPKPLLWQAEYMLLKPHQMLAGLSSLNNQKEIIEFDKTPHTLIAGITGAGKSVLLQMLLLSLVANTKPTELELILIDLKNEDLVPFKNLPHVSLFASTFEEAQKAIAYVESEKTKRIATGKKGKRIILVIDELAQLASSKALVIQLGSLASIGRSKKINLIAATQNVTKDGGIGSMMKANFTCRLIGKVAPGLSAVATGIANQFAHLLPGKGSFLRIEGNDNHRLQSYLIDETALKIAIDYIAEINPRTVLSNVSSPLVVELHRTASEPILEPLQNRSEPFVEPLTDKRPLTVQEALEVQNLYRSGLSKTALCKRVYGSKNGTYATWIDEALNLKDDNKIIQLRRNYA